MKLTQRFIKGLLGAVIILYPGSLFANYTIVLKSGGRITVERYWEERGMVKFYGLGGEIGIAKQQIQTILQDRSAEPQGMVLAAVEEARSTVEERDLLQEQSGGGLALADARATDLRIEKELRAQKEKDYQEMHDGITEAIKPRTDLHWLITRGKSTPDPTLLETLEALNGRIDDLKSRLKDAQHNPERARGTGIVNLMTNSAFAGQRETIELRHTGATRPGIVNAQPIGVGTIGVRLPEYSDSERELSELRNQLNELYEERKRLIEEFKREGLSTGSLPYEAFP
ncbi:MAG: hypothetical protein ACREQA_18200 [Candidatus Binatia bacterium]